MCIRNNMPLENSIRDVRAIALLGNSGVGKTRLVYSMFRHQDIARGWITSTGVWYNGYMGQPILLIDDIRKAPKGNEQAGLSGQEILQLTDIYDYLLPVKGEFVRANYRLIIFTSNVDVVHWLEPGLDSATLFAVHRRLSCIWTHTQVDAVATAHQFLKALHEHPNESRIPDRGGFPWKTFLRDAFERLETVPWYSRLTGGPGHGGSSDSETEDEEEAGGSEVWTPEVPKRQQLEPRSSSTVHSEQD